MTLDLLFGNTPPLDWTQKLARATLIFAYGLLLVRVFGRRVFGKWAALDRERATLGDDGGNRTLVGVALVAVARGGPFTLAVAHGRGSCSSPGRGRTGIDAAKLKSHAGSEADLLEALRKEGIGTSAEAELIILEPSGNISVLKK